MSYWHAKILLCGLSFSPPHFWVKEDIFFLVFSSQTLWTFSIWSGRTWQTSFLNCLLSLCVKDRTAETWGSRPHERQTCTRSDTFSTWRFPPFFWHFLIEPSEAGVTLSRSLPLVWLFITGFQTAARCKINWLCLKSNYFQVIASRFTYWKGEG